MAKKSFAIVLSGCGVFDGSEIHEAVMTMLAVDQHNCTYKIFAPDIEQTQTVNHFTKETTNEKRSVLAESARIARGEIKPLSEYKVADFDGIIFPGGFGAAKNLSTFATEGDKCKVNSDVEKAIRETHKANKPIGALCIAPVVIARVLGNVQITIGSDDGTAKTIEKMGGTHENTKRGEVKVDKKNKVVTTPCYMLDSTIKHIHEGAYNLVKAMIKL
ncbi:MAG: isoprenoid biosynthesis glyoxalase ElbB [Salinivirgaceae bacterium]|jgi:enhancing lycopene biosynthesis protein 2|nr:isoprenoid biosynthesis glyoxalase ElbB [Bacteroidales bacterium]